MASVIGRTSGFCNAHDWRSSILSYSPPVLPRSRSFSCRASCRNSQEYGYDLYELLGVERNATQQEIRRSYRWLQKKCHPDIAGLVGHDMSILLNQAYKTLSDANQRAAYDQSLTDFFELEGYTGLPLYSKWFGPAHEDSAIFVDENHCVGCLKCALIAPNTFAIENKFGRARAVGQWADTKPAIEAAMKACPVDCITWVNRSQLAAFEFVMSKEPRFPVGVEVHSNGGVKTSDVFKAVERFLEKLKKKEESELSHLKETSRQREARLAALQAVQARSGRWWYYFVGNPDAQEHGTSGLRREACGAIVPLNFYEAGRKTQDAGPQSKQRGTDNDKSFRFQGQLHRLFEAATGQKWWEQASPGGGGPPLEDEYWVPLPRTGGHVMNSTGSKPETSPALNAELDRRSGVNNHFASRRKVTGWANQMITGLPFLTATTAAWFIGVTSVHPGVALTDAEVGVAPIPMEWMHGIPLQMALVAVAWYLIGAAFVNGSALVIDLLHAQDDEMNPPSA